MPLSDAARRAPHLALLEPWAMAAEAWWYDIPGRPDQGCYGTGYNTWGVQTQQKYLSAMAALATDPATDEQAAGMSRQQMIDRTLSALRYNLATHVSGTMTLTDNTQWGHTWISALGVERMMNLVDAFNAHLTDADRADVRRMLTSEADWLAEEHEVVAGLWSKDGRNKPEANLWNGAILWRTAAMYDDDSRRDRWMERATEYFLNGVNVPADAEDATVIAGRPLRQWQVGGANFFPNFGLDHHEYLNVGYQVICLSNLALFHYGMKARGAETPAAAFHHARDLWQLVRRLVFSDGRLARIGGDSRVRYCYCQDYLLPVLPMAAELWGDDLAPHLEAGQLGIIAEGQQHNGDGSYHGKRIAHIADASPYYYTRLESDTASCLANVALWRRLWPELPAAERAAPERAANLERDLGGTWVEPEHGGMFHRSPTRLASWSWRACELPQGMCLPPDDGHMGEWAECLAGRVTAVGELRAGHMRAVHTLRRHTQAGFDGGFVTCGTTTDGTNVLLEEGYRAAELVEHHVAFAALPDDHTALRLELATVGPMRCWIRDVRGMKLNVANDLWNGFERAVSCATGDVRLRSVDDGNELVQPLGSPWASVEGRVGAVAVYGTVTLALYRVGRRRGGNLGSLFYDELCSVSRVGPFAAAPGEALIDGGEVVFASVSVEATRDYAERGAARRLTCDTLDARAMLAEGQDGRRYLLVANFGPDGDAGASAVSVELEDAASAEDLATGERLAVSGGALRIEVAPGSARLLRVE